MVQRFDFKSLPEEVKPFAVTNFLVDELIAGAYHSLDSVFKNALEVTEEEEWPRKSKAGEYALKAERERVHFLLSAAEVVFDVKGEIID